MPQSRIKKKNPHLKPKVKTFHRPTTKVASTVLLAGALTTSAEILFDFQAPKVAAATNTQETFIENIAAVAKPVADSNGLYPSVMIAQAILESDWGQSGLSKAPYYNLFGIQGSYQGHSVSFSTQEFIGGKFVTKVMPFRVYPSHLESLKDNARVLKTTNFGAGPFYQKAWRTFASTYEQATAALTGTYATSPLYARSLNQLIAQYHLTRYDDFSSQPLPTPPSSQQTTTTYTVRSGDTLWAISQNYGVSIAQIKNWNHLNSDMIYVNQKLVLTTQLTPTTPTTPETPQVQPPKTPVPQPSVPQQQATIITVVKGNTLSGLAQKYHTSVTQIKTWNNLKSDLILIGQKLVVSKTTNQTKAPNQQDSQAPTQTAQTKIYKVVSGDSLWKLSQENHVSIQQIKAWNHLSSDLILVGQYLRVQ